MDLIKSFYIGKPIFLANENKIEVITINSIQETKNTNIKINEIYLIKTDKDKLITKTKNGFFDDSYQYFFTKEAAEKNYAKKKNYILKIKN